MSFWCLPFFFIVFAQILGGDNFVFLFELVHLFSMSSIFVELFLLFFQLFFGALSFCFVGQFFLFIGQLFKIFDLFFDLFFFHLQLFVKFQQTFHVFVRIFIVHSNWFIICMASSFSSSCMRSWILSMSSCCSGLIASFISSCMRSCFQAPQDPVVETLPDFSCFLPASFGFLRAFSAILLLFQQFSSSFWFASRAVFPEAVFFHFLKLSCIFSRSLIDSFKLSLICSSFSFSICLNSSNVGFDKTTALFCWSCYRWQHHYHQPGKISDVVSRFTPNLFKSIAYW